LRQTEGMNSHEQATQLTQFRQEVYQNFNKRADALMDLLDALSSQSRAQSVVELSLESCFRREHTSVFKAIASYSPKWMKKSLAQLASLYLPHPRQRPFWALGVDTTPQPRPYARTLKDRGYVYQPALLQSNKPVTIGHCYAELALLPEREVQQGSAWVVPLSCQRVSSAEDKELVGAIQMNVLLDDPTLPFHNQLCVEVGDTSYSKPKYLFANRPKSNLVSLVRVRQYPHVLSESRPCRSKAFSWPPNLVWRCFLAPGPADLALKRMKSRTPPRPVGVDGSIKSRSKPGMICSCAASVNQSTSRCTAIPSPSSAFACTRQTAL
jgi:hypothetical protein